MSKATSLFRKPAPDIDPNKSDLDRKIASLNAHRAATVLEILQLEKAGRKREPISTTQTIEERAASFLGDTQPGHRRRNLSELDADIEAIDRALAIAGARSEVERSQIVARLSLERAPAWADIVRRRALAIAELLRVNTEAEAFVADLVEAGGRRPALPLQYPSGRLLGVTRQSSGPAYDFLTQAANAGFVTEKDLKKNA